MKVLPKRIIMDPDFTIMMKELGESYNSLMLDHFHEQVKSNYVSRKENMEDKLKIKQLEMQLQSANSKLKKTTEPGPSGDAFIEIDNNQQARLDLSGIKREPQVAMPNIPNSNPTKKRKLSAETTLLEFKSTKRSGDNVAVLNKKLYEKYSFIHTLSVSQSSGSRECYPSWKIREYMKSCMDVYNRSICPYDGGHEAMEFLFARLSFSEQPSIDNLKLFFEKITEEYGDSIKCTEIHLITIKGHEVWLVQDYEEGPGKSLWFRQVFKLIISI